MLALKVDKKKLPGYHTLWSYTLAFSGCGGESPVSWTPVIFVYRGFIYSFLSWSLLTMDGDTNGSADVSEGSGPDRRRRVHGMLKLYYGMNEEGKADEQPASLDPCDINGPHFDPEHFLNKV